MPRSLINILGVVVTLGVLALGILLVAMPIGLQALGVVGQTALVTGTNAMYQSQIDALREQEQHLEETQASVASLRTQITPANELDDVFEVVAKAAESSDVTITSVSTGELAAFAVRTSPTAIDVVAEPAPAADPSADPAATTATGQGESPSSTPNATTASGRTQIDFTITVTAGDMNKVVAFLDALRAGPRLLGQVQTTVAPTGSTFSVTIAALAFVLPLEG